jgi:glycosyltransferase involved in cell wall biosynthesis
MSTSRAGCTIIAGNYLAQARVLARSFRAFHPEADFYVLLADDPRSVPVAAGKEPFLLVTLDELALPDLPALRAHSSLKELATAVKPAFLQHLLERKGHEKALFLDPDILVLDSLEPLFQALDRSSVLLTPHALSPVPRGVIPGDREILLVGTYNLGFIGVARTPEGLRILEWWADRLTDGCKEDIRNGLFVDQKWMDLVPGFTDEAEIIRDPGYNVAYWNLHERVLTQEKGVYLVNGLPLRFYHFSGYLPEKPEQTAVYETTQRVTDQPALVALRRRYAELLREAGYDLHKHAPYAFAAPPPAAPASVLTPPPSLLARRHQWEPYQRFCRLMRRMLGTKRFLALRARIRRSTPQPAAVHYAPGALQLIPFGVNVSGYLSDTSGVAQATRGNLDALTAAGVPHVFSPLSHAARSTNAYPEQPYRFNLIQLNADQTPIFAGGVKREYFHDRYSIGYWMWEAHPFPERWLRNFSPLQEIWTASRFTADILSAVSPVPVRIIPHAVRISPPGAKGRADFGLPADRFLFLFVFDYLSVFERKNPLAIVSAFREAFPSGEPVTLVLKTLHGDDCPAERRILREALRGLPAVHLEEDMPRADVEDLLACCDAYVSLHRSEGFGLTIAEAMALGKPVIATRYGGNTDFMDAETAFPVEYTEVTTTRDHGPYMAGSRWAEPDIAHAARCMRSVFDHPADAAAKAAKARDRMRTAYTPLAIGRLMQERLEQLARYY